MKRIIALLLCIVLAAGCALAGEVEEPEWLIQGKAALEAGDSGKALECFLVGADHGDAESMFYLGMLYFYGVEKSYEKAIAYWQQAADLGYAGAQFMLGEVYFNGYGVEPSAEIAAIYYRLAADQGIAEAQYYLGVMYENGYGVEQSDKIAAAYYQLAADQGLELAEEALKKLLAVPVTVPNLIGLDVDEARSLLEDADLQCEEIYIYSEEVKVNVVFMQTPNANTELMTGNTVLISVSRGPELLTMPDVTGMNVEEVQMLLKSYGLIPECECVMNSDYAVDTVLSQSPAAGEKVAKGSPVRIIYSGGNN